MWKIRNKFFILVNNLQENLRVLYYWFLNSTYWLITRIVYLWLRFIIIQTNIVRYLQELKKKIRDKKDNVCPDNQSLTGLMMKNDNSKT